MSNLTREDFETVSLYGTKRLENKSERKLGDGTVITTTTSLVYNRDYTLLNEALYDIDGKPTKSLHCCDINGHHPMVEGGRLTGFPRRNVFIPKRRGSTGAYVIIGGKRVEVIGFIRKHSTKGSDDKPITVNYLILSRGSK